MADPISPVSPNPVSPVGADALFTAQLHALQDSNAVTLFPDSSTNAEFTAQLAGSILPPDGSSSGILDSLVSLDAPSLSLLSEVNTTAAFPAPFVTLTPQQLLQLGIIVQPVAGQPLNQQLLAQLQAQFTAAGLNPQQISLVTLLLALNYLSGVQAENTSTNLAKLHHDTEKVEAVSATDEVAAEDMVIG